jgi:hypothetical protein
MRPERGRKACGLIRSRCRRADIPRDVSRKFRRRQTEVVKFRRNVVAGVIAEEDNAAGSLRAKDSRRRHVIVIPPPR